MYTERHVVDVVTSTGGAFTGYTPPVSGRVQSVAYTKTDFASTADIAVTLETGGDNLWTESNVNASKTVDPVRQAANAAGAAVTGVYDGVFAAKDRVKIVIAQGGNTKSGSFAVTVV